MQKKNLLSRVSVIVSVLTIASLAIALFAMPTLRNTQTKANTNICDGAPVTPTFNYWPVAYGTDANFPACHDLRGIDAAKLDGVNSPVFSQNEADWQNGLNLNIGDTGIALGYIHNGASNLIDRRLTDAHDVKIITSTDTAVGSSHTLKVTFTGKNSDGQPMAPFSETFTVNTPANAKLEVIPNSGNFMTYDHELIEDMQNSNLGNSTYNLGLLNACFEYSLFFTYKFKVVGVNQNAGLNITKGVRKFETGNYGPSVTVGQNERVQYRIQVTNTSTTSTANTVTLTDNSVAGISVEAGSVTVESPEGTRMPENLWQGTIPGTINLGNINPGESRIIKYNAKATGACNTYVNTATAQASNAAAVSATASVIVTGCTSGTPNLTIRKMVKNDTTGTSYADDSVQARTGDRVTFQVTVTNSGTAAVSNVVMNDVIPNGLNLESGTIRLDNNVAASLINVSLGTLNPGQSRVITFTTQVVAVGPATICNVATATGTGVNQVTDNACVQIVVIPKPGTPNIVLSKRAFNDTKNVDATTVNAASEDFITYTLVTTNNGTADAVNYVISDDLSQVLPLADMVATNGGTVNGQTISYPAVTIHPGETVVKTFKVRVKYSLAQNLSYQMKNTYGNTVVINIPGKQVFEAPKTGAAGTSAAVFAGLITAGFVVLRNGRSIVKFISA